MATEKRVFGTKIDTFQKPGVNPKNGMYEIKEYKPKYPADSKVRLYNPGKIQEYKIHEYKPHNRVSYHGNVEYQPQTLNHYYEYNPDHKEEPKPKPKHVKKPSTPVKKVQTPEPRPASANALWPANLKALGTIKRQINIFMDITKSRVQPSVVRLAPKSRERVQSSRGSRPKSGRSDNF